MAERRPTSLLDFAIAASVTVLPIMLGMLLLVAVLRPSEPARSHAASERYVSVRHVAALRTFERSIAKRVQATSAAPTAADVLAGVPRCSAEWGPRWTPVALLRSGYQPPPSQAERIAAQLSELDAALQRFGSRPNTRVAAPVGLQPALWFEAAEAALHQPFETPEYPGKRFQVGCADLSAALTALTRSNARMLDALAWRGTEVPAVVARWGPEQMVAISSGQVARRNPWNGVPGCIYLGATASSHFIAAAGSAEERICALPALRAPAASGVADRAPLALRGEPGPATGVDEARWMVPPSLQAMLAPLDTLRRPSGTLYRLYTDPPAAGDTSGGHGPNRITLDGAPVDVGFSIALTIDPALQALAQKTAACYTGRHEVCRAMGIRRAEDRDAPLGHRLLEGAMVRMAAVAIIDVESGRIEALAGALSPCARQEVDGPGRDAACDKRLPYPVQYRPDALLNPAVFHDAMPASTIKPIMAAAFLADPEVGARWLAAERAAIKPGVVPGRDSLRGQLMRSDSARFLDRMFCSDKNFSACRRPWNVQQSALAFGWNGGCDPARFDCGKQDLLFGRAVGADRAEAGPAPSLPVAFGRLMSEPVGGKLGAPLKLTPPAALNADIVRRCSLGADGRRGSDDDWEKCKGGSVVDVVAEGWGQGHARSSALGVAGMMSTLAAAANGQAQVQPPHLVQGLRGARAGDAALDSALARFGPVDARPNRISTDAAQVILSGLTYSHRNGTARSACEQVFDAPTCRGIDWIAGKTGTPSFPNDGRSLDELARLCGRADTKIRRSDDVACSSLRPYKWYVAAYRPDKGSGPWTKAIGVLTERNWNIANGQVHGAGDHGPNPSAEIALQIIGRQAGVIVGALP